MTGGAVRQLRMLLGLNPAHFAQLIGVHPSTLYRWEAAGDGALKIEPFQLQILAVMGRHGDAALGETILQGLLYGGPMLGLFKLLEAGYGPQGSLPTKRQVRALKRAAP